MQNVTYLNHQTLRKPIFVFILISFLSVLFERQLVEILNSFFTLSSCFKVKVTRSWTLRSQNGLIYGYELQKWIEKFDSLKPLILNSGHAYWNTKILEYSRFLLYIFLICVFLFLRLSERTIHCGHNYLEWNFNPKFKLELFDVRSVFFFFFCKHSRTNRVGQ